MARNSYIRSISTAVPENNVSQEEVFQMAKIIYSSQVSDFNKYEEVYKNTQIDQRNLCCPLEWYSKPHSWQERNEIYISESLRLLERVALESIEKAELNLEDIDDIVLISSTGISTPSLEAVLMEKLKFSSQIHRTPIFGLGCAGGLLGLARCAQMNQYSESKNILLIAVELCSLCFQSSDFDQKNIIATALFADGAAGAVISRDGNGPQITSFYEHRFKDSLGIMGWDVTDTGLSVIFSKKIPHLVRTELGGLVEKFLGRESLTLNDVDHFVSHPGGSKVISAIEESCGLQPNSMTATRKTLKNYGNMSAPTILFALKEAIEKECLKGKILLSTLGPGFTCGLMGLEN